MTFTDGFMFAAGKAAFGIACALGFLALLTAGVMINEAIQYRKIRERMRGRRK